MSPHLPGDVDQSLMFIFQLHPEHGVRQRFNHGGHYLNGVVFTHTWLSYSDSDTALGARIRSSYPSSLGVVQGCQNLRAVFRHGHDMLKVGRVPAVGRHSRPLVRKDFHLIGSFVDHRFDG